jgi:hypothetical protein
MTNLNSSLLSRSNLVDVCESCLSLAADGPTSMVSRRSYVASSVALFSGSVYRVPGKIIGCGQNKACVHCQYIFIINSNCAFYHFR